MSTSIETQQQLKKINNVCEPIKSELDKLKYLSFFLENGLQVLLISDPETEKSAAAMDIKVGSFSDPDDIPGLAHFLEHMLFMGTEKYPSENEYSSFLSENAGNSNAFTSAENTNFYFSVTKDKLKGALDRFAQFFISPLFNESSTEREIQAVNNENQKNLQSDAWRENQLLKSLANKKHPHYKFGTGDVNTLKNSPTEKGIDVRSALLKFHATYYFASQMKLVIYGAEPIEQLQDWTIEMFSGIPKEAKLVAPELTKELPYPKESLSKIIKVVPVKENRSLKLFWILPSLIPKYNAKPERYISHLIGHEGPGSILSILKNKGWANSLSAGTGRRYSNFEIFQVSIDLTQDGLDNYEEVIGLIYDYIKLINSNEQNRGPEFLQKWIFDELALVSQNQFKFKQKSDPISLVSYYGSQMQLFDAKEILIAPYLFRSWEPEIIQSFMNYLTVNNMLVFLVSKGFESKTDKNEFWYGTSYSEETVVENLIQRCEKSSSIDNGLALPKINPFIASRFDLFELSSNAPKVPILIKNTPFFKLWHKQDDTFKLPKYSLFLSIETPKFYLTPTYNVMGTLFKKLCSDALNEYSYYADIAGLSYSLTSELTGIHIYIQGYNEKLSLLLLQIVEKIKNLRVNAERFKILKEKLMRTLKNTLKGQAWEQSRYVYGMSVAIPRWQVEEKINALERVTLEQLQDYSSRLFEEGFIEGLSHGNMVQADIENIATQVENILFFNSIPLPNSLNTQLRVVQLKKGVKYIRQEKGWNSEDQNSAIFHNYQIGLENLEDDVKVDVITQLIEEPAYDQLRTKEQLGYIVWSGCSSIHGVQRLYFLIQSSSHNPIALEESIEKFVDNYREILIQMSEEDFRKQVKAVILRKKEKDQNLYKETQRHWAKINKHKYDFAKTEKEIARLETITKEEIINFYDQYLFDRKERTICSVQVFAEKYAFRKIDEKDEQIIEIDNYDKFKRSMSLYPINC
eukprot:TRINITY_DN250_c0_g1_i1.p1 TRINITY_DN250_c0_g1~~TRINITY_DN250_c0_g1_i1.p1  ORF type:complete len:1068 (-),score=379.42 TRINITY_DN250_c0_g1_i1:64-2979(-)